MNKKRVILASTLAILVAPSVLGPISNNMATPVRAATTATATIKNPIGTVDYGGTDAVDINGKKTGLFLSGKSSWKLGKSVLINNQRYYEVGTNQYVSSQNITLTDGMPAVTPILLKPADANQTGTLGYAVKLVDSQGNNTGRVLPAGSSWKLGGLYQIGENNYYQVGNNEYALAIVMGVSSNTSSNQNNYTAENRTIGLSVKTPILDDNGNQTGNYLPANSFWHTDRSKTINNYKYYRVATNQWVTIGGTTSSTVFGNGPITITLSKDVQIYDSASNSMTRTLPAGSSWKASSAVKNSNNEIYVQVAKTEWIRLTGTNLYGGFNTFEEIATYGTTSQPNFATNVSNNNTSSNNNVRLTTTLIGSQSVYNTSSNTMSRTLPAGSSWKINQVVRNKNNEFWGKVSTNEWLLIDTKNMNMSMGDSDEVPNVTISEPEFATSVIK